MLKTVKYPNPNQFEELLQRPVLETDYLESSVRNILNRVKTGGDTALLELTKMYDKAQIDELRVSEKEVEEAKAKVSDELKNAIQQAYDNIYKFHKSQKREEEKIETSNGVTCWRKSLPIEKVGLYIPGGSAPLFSSVLMLGVPAQIAGSREVILCTPPQSDGKVNPAILFTADLVGIKQIFKVGGAQAVAAMAFGTSTITKVDKIFGPGNQYVTAAKQMVSLQGTAIDMPAGPSEVMVLTDEAGNAEFIASDLLSQAEHGADSQVVLVSTDEKIISSINIAIEQQLAVLSRKEIAREALTKSVAILVKSYDEMMEVSNFYAPEHLIIASKNADELAEKVTNAGSVFIGEYTPEAAGDYASGTNHTLPTNGAARAYSGVSLDSFTKQVTFQKISAKGIQSIGRSVELMAEAEQLQAHKNAVTLRLNAVENGN